MPTCSLEVNPNGHVVSYADALDPYGAGNGYRNTPSKPRIASLPVDARTVWALAGGIGSSLGQLGARPVIRYRVQFSHEGCTWL